MKTSLLFFLLFVCTLTHASEDYIATTTIENVHFRYWTGWGESETFRQADMLQYLLARLLKAKGYKDHVYISFKRTHLNHDTSYCGLSYEPFEYYEETSRSFFAKKTCTGLKLMMKGRHLDVGRMLKLINGALSNIQLIKSIQVNYYIRGMLHEIDTISAIPLNSLNNLVSVTDTVIERILGEKTFRNIYKMDRWGEIDYFFQNNRFHFYITEQPHVDYSEKLEKYIAMPTTGDDILVVDSISEIIGNRNDGHFVFTNDSTFYFIERYFRGVRGPFGIDSLHGGRLPVSKYFFDNNNRRERYFLLIHRFDFSADNRDRKVLFIPDSILVSDYGRYENDLITSLYIKPLNREKEQKPKSIPIALLSVLALSTLLNIWLWIRRK